MGAFYDKNNFSNFDQVTVETEFEKCQISVIFLNMGL